MKLKKTKKSKVYIPRTEAEKEQVKIKEFLDLCSPSVLKFYPDYYICGNAFRCVWAIREYPANTDELALLRHLGDRSGITLRIYTRTATSSEEKKILENASSRNLMDRSSGNMQKEVIADANIGDVASLAVQLRREGEILLHCAVFIEISAPTLEKLKEMQSDVEAELTRSKIAADKLFLRQRASRVCSRAAGTVLVSSSNASSPLPVQATFTRSITAARQTRRAFISVTTNTARTCLLILGGKRRTRPIPIS